MMSRCAFDKKLTCEECRLNQQYVDRDDATGKAEILHKCAILLANDMLGQLANKQNQMGAAIESFRNEMVRLNDPDQRPPDLKLLG